MLVSDNRPFFLVVFVCRILLQLLLPLFMVIVRDTDLDQFVELFRVNPMNLIFLPLLNATFKIERKENTTNFEKIGLELFD